MVYWMPHLGQHPQCFRIDRHFGQPEAQWLPPKTLFKGRDTPQNLACVYRAGGPEAKCCDDRLSPGHCLRRFRSWESLTTIVR